VRLVLRSVANETCPCPGLKVDISYDIGRHVFHSVHVPHALSINLSTAVVGARAGYIVGRTDVIAYQIRRLGMAVLMGIGSRSSDDSPRRARRGIRPIASFSWLAVAISVVVGCSNPPPATSSAAPPLPTKQSESLEPSAVRSALLERLRHLAEEGNLFDPQAAAQTLRIKLQTSRREGYPNPPMDCGDGTKRSSLVTTVTATGPSWFHALPSGAGHIAIPAYAINPSGVSGDPTLEYQIYHSIYCRDWPRLQDATEANLSFNGLPAYTCLTPANIKDEIPEAQFVQATDGVFLVTFQGRLRDDSGTALTFWFRAGADCALGASLQQSQEDGLRYRRAVYKYELCRGPVEHAFCSEHGSFGWADSALLKKMVVQVYERCGTVNSFYVREPATGDLPPRLTRDPRRLPCEGR
jgi:hypothetical protein